MAYRPVRKKPSRIWDFQLKLILPMNLRLSGHFCINCNAKMGYFTMVVPPKGPTPAKHCGIRGQCVALDECCAAIDHFVTPRSGTS
jgi:hypothetical protein